MDWLSLMCACIALCVMESSVTSATSCIHQPSQIIANVVQNTNSSDGREKRETHEPLRTHFHYDNSINTMLDSTQRGRLQNVVIPGLDNFFKSALSVIRATSPILLERGCVDQQYFLPVGNPRECVSQCLNPPMCGLTQIPEEHLKRCVECNDDDNSCDTRPGTVDGAGVPNTDLIIYVSAVCTETEVEGGLLAFASCCELENELDRPIAGYINFCPSPFANLTDDGAIALGIHEVMHAIGFSSSLFQWFRDENGNPRTARGQDGSPPSVPSTNTVRTETYTDWSTRDGLVNHEVTLLVTPNVVEQARLHYNCSNIIGVELENQGGEGTAGSHWEQRIMGNEGMTGVTLFTCPFSRITLGLFQDTGWYIPNYEVADAFAWGLNSGCTIPHGSCREYITQQQESGRSISPYCVDVDDDTRGCTMDHEFISHCNLESDVDPPPTSLYQFFDTSASYGGRTETADYCPFEDAIPSTRCSEASNSPSVNNGGQLYGVGSRCFQLGRDWTRTNSIGTEGRYTTAAGCYRYNCTSSGVEIILEGVSFLCSCAGEEIIVDTTVNGIRYQGSYICPSCASVCYDDLESCPSAEPAACPGRVTVPDPCSSSPCEVNAACVRDSVMTDSFTCTCIPPFEANGTNCEVPDPCSSSPCDTNAACVRDSVTTDSFTCACIPSFEADGISCEVPDPCSSSPCEVNAACVRDSLTTDSFTCTCIPPFEANGISCEVPDPCSSSPCDTNAACVRDSVTTDSFTCICIPPFEANGISCEDPNPCNSGPCDVNAECTITGLTLPEFNCSCNPGFVGDGFICSGMTMGADPHFSVVLPSKKLLCFSIMGEQGFSYNLISNSKLVMNALFSPDSKKDGVTWIGALGIIAKNAERANQVAVSFTARQHRIEFNKVKVSPENIGKIRFKKGQVYISDRSSPIPHGVYPSVLIIIEDVGVNFTVHFMNEHLDLFWHNTLYHNHTQDFHGLIGQFFRKGVEIDTTRKIIILPNKEPVPVIRRPLWSFMEREPQHDQFCWTAMNAGHQGKGLIEGEYNDYLVDNIGTDHFKFAG